MFLTALAARQIEIHGYVSRRLENAEIARLLGISGDGVKNTSSWPAPLGASTRAEASSLAYLPDYGTQHINAAIALNLSSLARL